jgi:FkbM family methyltransferase
MEEKVPVNNIGLLRLVSRILPLKYKLNGLIKKYLQSKYLLVIPYINKYAIVVKADTVAESTISNLIFEGGRYLPEYQLLQQIKATLPNNYVYVDAGANMGTIIWQLADGCGHIYAFEPIPKLHRIIDQSAQYNAFHKLSLFDKAVGSKPGRVQMVDNDNSSVLNDAAVGDGLSIEVTTLDIGLVDIAEIDFIKIDVEGFEWEVLQGAVNILNKHKPKLLVELHPIFLKNYGIDYRKVLDLLEQQGYSIAYHSFLEETRMGRIERFLSRYSSNSGKQFNTRQAFIDDVETLPAKLSYHLYCEHKAS